MKNLIPGNSDIKVLVSVLFVAGSWFIDTARKWYSNKNNLEEFRKLYLIKASVETCWHFANIQ